MQKMFLVVAILLMTGCVQTTVYQKLYRDGTADVAVTFTADSLALSGFKTMSVNPELKDKSSLEQTSTNITYMFSRTALDKPLFTNVSKGSQFFFKQERYVLESKPGFPFYKHKYTVNLKGMGETNETDDQPAQFTDLLSVTYVVDVFGSITDTDATKVDRNTVTFTANALEDTEKTVEFREFFLSAWLG